MIYRPHFPYETPEGCTDEPYEYYWDSTNIHVQSVTLGSPVPAILLGPLDKDAPFHWRGFRIFKPIDRTTLANLAYAVQFRVNGELISDDTINLALYGVGAGFSGQFQGGQSVPFDEEIICPPGAVIESTWSNELAATPLTMPPLPGVTMWGVKRYSGEVRIHAHGRSGASPEIRGVAQALACLSVFSGARDVPRRTIRGRCGESARDPIGSPACVRSRSVVWGA